MSSLGLGIWDNNGVTIDEYFKTVKCMTPKEKAQELIIKFTPATRQFDERDGWTDYIDSAIQCSLIAVEMVINQFNGIYESLKVNKIINGKVEESENYKFWNEVKSILLSNINPESDITNIQQK